MLCILNVGTVPTWCNLNVGTVPKLCILNVWTVPMLCFLNVGTVPTFSSSLPYQKVYQAGTKKILDLRISEPACLKAVFEFWVLKCVSDRTGPKNNGNM